MMTRSKNKTPSSSRFTRPPPAQQETQATSNTLIRCTLESSDHAILLISTEAMKQSKIFSNILTNIGIPEKDEKIVVPNVCADTLRRIVEWSERHKADNSYVLYSGRSHRGSRGLQIPDWDSRFLNRLNNQELFDVICAANYLDIPKLMDYSCKTVANMAKGKSPEQMRVLFGIPTDEEESEAALSQPGPSNA